MYQCSQHGWISAYNSCPQCVTYGSAPTSTNTLPAVPVEANKEEGVDKPFLVPITDIVAKNLADNGFMCGGNTESEKAYFKLGYEAALKSITPPPPEGKGRTAMRDGTISDFAKVADWAFRHGWRERARMTGVNAKFLDRQYYEQIRIMLENKFYEKAFENEHLGKIYKHPNL